ncbi:MAG: cation-translocating P-type ATPase, partial [Planctomycetaceae bacterium]
GKAAKALEPLREKTTPSARVSRPGQDQVVPAAEVARGDLVVLAAGDRVPADLRLVTTASLEVDESMLTGESLPVGKDAGGTDAEDTPMADRRTMIYSGTLVTRGSAEGLAIATGEGTELGAIAQQVGGREQRTPLQVELAHLTKTLGAISVAVAAAVFALTLFRMGITEGGFQRSFLAAVALAVAAVPEGLATVVTVGLALGVQRMAARGAIIRRLPAVETLGCTTVIATDKTGTLTTNRLRVEGVVTGDGAIPLPDAAPRIAARIEEVAALCNDATLDPAAGDPLDIALLEAVGAARVDELRAAMPRVDAVPFDSDRKRMATLHGNRDGGLLLVKGAPEAVLPLCRERLRDDGAAVSLPPDEADRLHRQVDDLAVRGMRVLALAHRLTPVLDERDLVFLGLVCLGDSIRPEARGAVEEATAAGISLVMVTGDHAGTAGAIARSVGLASESDPVMTGAELETRGFPEDPTSVPVYARVDPGQKLELVRALQTRGEVVAVTGDGVNDAPALKHAEIGVAMGRGGSDVAREASDMVVTDDDLATIVAAVREGRGIYENIRKVVDYLITGNFSEIVVVVTSLLLFPALGVPLLPLQLLWVNLLTDGPPALALGVDPTDPLVMRQRPRSKAERMLTGIHLGDLFIRGAIIATAAIGAFAIARFGWDQPWAHARTMMFTVLVFAHLTWAFAARRPHDIRGLLANRWLLLAVGAGILLQIVIVMLPAAQSLFRLAPLGAGEWALAALMGLAPVAVIFALPWRAVSEPARADRS